MQILKEIFGIAAAAMEAVGVLIILAGAVLASLWFLGQLREGEMAIANVEYRRRIGKAIILGLEFLIA